jgi:hypothetical protein
MPDLAANLFRLRKIHHTMLAESAGHRRGFLFKRFREPS